MRAYIYMMNEVYDYQHIHKSLCMYIYMTIHWWLRCVWWGRRILDEMMMMMRRRRREVRRDDEDLIMICLFVDDNDIFLIFVSSWWEREREREGSVYHLIMRYACVVWCVHSVHHIYMMNEVYDYHHIHKSMVVLCVYHLIMCVVWCVHIYMMIASSYVYIYMAFH